MYIHGILSLVLVFKENVSAWHSPEDKFTAWNDVNMNLLRLYVYN